MTPDCDYDGPHAEDPKLKEYPVALRNPNGVITWSTYPSKDAFEDWYLNGVMKDGTGHKVMHVYAIVTEGSEEDAVAACESEENAAQRIFAACKAMRDTGIHPFEAHMMLMNALTV